MKNWSNQKMKIANKRTEDTKVPAARHPSAVEPIRVATAQPPMSTAEASEVKRTRNELDEIRAKLPVTPYSALDAKHRAQYVKLRAAMLAHREAAKKARASRTK